MIAGRPARIAATASSTSDKSRHLLAAALARLDEEEMPAVRDQHGLRAREARNDLGRADGAGDEVVLAGDHEGLRLDPRKVGPEVEDGEDLFVEEAQRVAVRRLVS